MSIRHLKHIAKRVVASSLVMALLLAPTVANACMPSSVFFDFGSASLGAQAFETVAREAETFRGSRNSRIRLIAQNDGSDAGARMSRRRAREVKAALVRRGVPARAIVIETRNPSNHMMHGEGDARLVVIDFFTVSPAPTSGSSGTC